MEFRNLRNDLYPEIEPYAHGMLSIDEKHSLYWEQAGNPDGVPVLFLHGGPGAGAAPSHRRFFDPQFYRIVIFDQRGCGRSKPHASVIDNTTPHLIADIEHLRRYLGIDHWLLFGGSWGSTLALTYAIHWPEKCLGLILRGLFLGSWREIEWFLFGMGTFFPEAWRAFAGYLPEHTGRDLLAAYYRRLIDPDPAVHRPAAISWSRYETACSNLVPRTEEYGHSPASRDNTALALARIEAHYFINNVFLAEGEILECVHLLRRLPSIVVQGRYDMICPILGADTLVRAWPEVKYVVVPDAGHSAMEPGIRTALIRATETMKTRTYTQ